MSVSLAQFVGCEGSSFKQVQVPGLGLFWYRMLGRCKTLFLWVGDGGCYQELCGKWGPLFCSVLFCSVPTWLEVCRAVVREFFYCQKRLIIIILVPQPHDPFFLLGQGRGVPEASPPHSQIQDVCVTFVIIINNCRKSWSAHIHRIRCSSSGCFW